MVHDLALDPLLAALVADGSLRCSRCGGRLEQHGAMLHCVECTAAFPLRGGVPDLVTTYKTQGPHATIPPSFVDAVISALRLPDDDHTRASVVQAIDDTMLVTADGALTAEIAELADRIGVDEFSKPASAKEPLRKPRRWFALRRHRFLAFDSLSAKLALVRHYIGPTLTADSLLLRSFRIRNECPVAWTAGGDTTFALLAEWTDYRQKAQPALTTATPIATTVQPRAETTAIVKLRTPPLPGTYSLRIELAANGRRLSAAAAFAIPLVVGPATPLPPEITSTADGYSYTDDHDQANRMLWRFLAARGSKDTLRLLEIGGGINPQAVNMTHLGHAIIAADVSVAMGQLGRLCHRDFATHPLDRALLAFVACDAKAPPLAAGSLDGIVMYASFHHFPDPVALLIEFRRILATDGFVALMCEPCAPDPDEPTYLRDLRKGINEQNFAPEEYMEIFARSGMRIVTGRIDGGSLKVILAAA